MQIYMVNVIIEFNIRWAFYLLLSHAHNHIPTEL